MNRSSLLSTLLVTSSATLFLACGGGSSSAGSSAPAPAHGLAYTNPPSTGWRFEKDPSSTATHLVLRLVGPDATNGRGVGLTLHSDTSKMAWGRLNGAYIQDVGQFELATDPSNPNEPRLLVGGARGSDLMVGAFQKDPALTAKALNVPLFLVAIDFNGKAGLHSGDAIPLAVTKARMLPEDLSLNKLVDVTVATGKLVAE